MKMFIIFNNAAFTLALLLTVILLVLMLFYRFKLNQYNTQAVVGTIIERKRAAIHGLLRVTHLACGFFIMVTTIMWLSLPDAPQKNNQATQPRHLERGVVAPIEHAPIEHTLMEQKPAKNADELSRALEGLHIITGLVSTSAKTNTMLSALPDSQVENESPQ